MRKTTVLLTILCLSLMTTAVSADPIGKVRQFVRQSGPPGEWPIHHAATLSAVRMFAEVHDLPDPLDAAMPHPAGRDAIWIVWHDTLAMAEAYAITPAAAISNVDPNAPTARHRALILAQTDAALEQLQTKAVDKHIENLTRPLRLALAEELKKPTATYVTAGGVQREAVTERAVRLRQEIDAIERRKQSLLDSFNGLYREARIQHIMDDRACPRGQAAQVTDAWLARKATELERQQAAEKRRAEQRQRLEQGAAGSRRR